MSFFSSKSSQVHGSPSLGGTVTVTVEDVDAQNTLVGSGHERGGGSSRQGNEELGLHGCLLGCLVLVVMYEGVLCLWYLLMAQLRTSKTQWI